MADEQVTHVEEAIIGKITMANIKTDPSAVKKMDGDGAECPLARIYGTLDDVREQFDKNAGVSYTYFAGSFEAINMQDGDVYKSGKLFLPKGISELVESTIQQIKKDLPADKKTDSVALDFAFEVRSIKAKNPAGYTYKVYPLVSPERSDRLKQLRDKVRKAGTISTRQLSGQQRGSGPVTLEGNAAKKSA